MDCATSALFITEQRDDHHPKDAATVTAAVFQKSGGYPYKVDHESVHRSDSSPRQQHYPKPAQRAGLTGFLTILSSSCRPRLDVHTAGAFWLSGQVISAQGISGRTGGMNRRGLSSQAPEDMSEPSVDIIAQRCQLCTHHGVKGGGKLARVLGCAPGKVKRTLERAVSGCQELVSYNRGWLGRYHPPIVFTCVERERNSRHNSRRCLLPR